MDQVVVLDAPWFLGLVVLAKYGFVGPKLEDEDPLGSVGDAVMRVKAGQLAAEFAARVRAAVEESA